MSTTMDKDRLKHKIDRLRKRRAMFIANNESLTLSGTVDKAFNEGMIYAYEEVYLDLLDYIEERDGIDLNKLKRELDVYEKYPQDDERFMANVVRSMVHCNLSEDPISCKNMEMIDNEIEGETYWIYLCELTKEVCPRAEFRFKREWDRLKGELKEE